MSSPLVSEVLERLNREKIPLERLGGQRILVTGGAGFIGSWLVEALVRLGAKAFVADNLWRGSLDNLARPDGKPWIPLAEQFLHLDLREYHAALSACVKASPDYVFHLADVVAGVDYVLANEPFLFRANILINTNVFSAVQQTAARSLVYLGTACSYPRKLQEKPGGQPLVEEQVYPADPESSYGWSKLLGDYEAGLIAANGGPETGILRLHNVYGPRAALGIKRSQVIPSLIRKAIRHPEEDFVVWGSGKQARDFVFVGDVLDALLRLPFRGMGRGAIQIGTATETTVAEVAAKIVTISGKPIQIKFDTSKPEGDGGRSGDYSKAREILGWNVNTDLAHGLEQTYAWAAEQIQERKIDLLA